MKIIPQFLVNFLLSVVWQVAMIALVAAFADRLLRSVARLRHIVWVMALLLAVALPLFSSISSLRQVSTPQLTRTETAPETGFVILDNLPETVSLPPPPSTRSGFEVAQRTAAILIACYLLVIVYRSARLFGAWLRTRRARKDARVFEPNTEVQGIVDQCREVFGGMKWRVFKSRSLRAPVTVGVLRPMVILPEELLGESDLSALTAAIGHEAAHISRRDYLLNLIYELIFLPLSFHPAAALIKRRLIHTRELRCDELVAERLLHPEAYARSLVHLASWAMPFNRRAQTISVGIADDDILEVRIMSLLKKSNPNIRKRLWLVIVAIVALAIPCVAAATWKLKFNVASPETAQEPSREEQKKLELRSRREQEIKEKLQHEAEEITEGLKTETNAEVRAKLEKRLAQLKEEMANPVGWTAERENFVVNAEVKRKWELEDRELKQKIEQETSAEIRAQLEQTLKNRQQEREKLIAEFDGKKYAVTLAGEDRRLLEEKLGAARQIELAGRAKISMDQAIQIATSQQPGKVLECSLVGEHWESPGKLAADATVLYHVVIISNDATNPTVAHVLVNAVDGTIVRTLPKRR